MNEPEMVEQKNQPNLVQQIDMFLDDLEYRANGIGIRELNMKDVGRLKDYIYLLRQQAQKASNQRKTLKAMNKSHQAVVMENRWLRELISSDSVIGIKWASVMERARKTLWSQFRWLRLDKGAQDQLSKLAKFIVAEIPGEPSRSEGAADTIIRWAKNVKNIHGDDPLVWPEMKGGQGGAGKAIPTSDGFGGAEPNPALMFDMGGASAEDIINGDAPVGLTGPGGEEIFRGTWANLKERLQGLSEHEKAKGRNRGI